MKTLLVVMVFLLTGCAQVGMVTDRAAEANDAALDSALFMVCSGASIGSIRREFGSPDRAVAWRQLCMLNNEFSPL